MRVVDVFKGGAVEARCVCQILEEAGIECQLDGGELGTAFGLATSWTMASILVSEEDAERARKILAERLGQPSEDPQPKWTFQYGMRVLLVNFTLVAVVLGFYRPLGPVWPDFACGAFYVVLLGNVMAYVYVRKRQRQLEDDETNADKR